MKVTLVSINSKYIHSSLGIWYLFAAAKEIDKSEEINIIEGTINQPINDLIEEILKEDFDVIGFSSYIWNIEISKKIASIIKKLYPDKTIFFGGPEASFDAKELIKNDYIDFIIKGEGEEVFQNLLNTDFKISEEIIQGSISKYINPYTPEYFQKLNGRIVYFETSRGCPFSCSFCLSGRNENVRFFDFDECMNNLIKLANSGTQTIKFVDRTFNCNDKRALEIFKFINKKLQEGLIPKNVVFHFEIEAELFSKETIEFLKTIPEGLFQFEAGLQSFNKQTLKAVFRNEKIEKLVENLKEIAKIENIHLHIDLIAGLPFEDFESFKQGFNLAYEINADVIQLGFLKLLKGSTLETQKEEHSFITQDFSPYQVMENKYISYNDLVRLHSAEDAVERLLNSQKFKLTIEFALEKLKIQAFDLFLDFGEYIKDKGIKNPSFDLYASHLYSFLIAKENITEKELRDVMAKDFMICHNTGKLPKFLQIFDKRLKDISASLKQDEHSFFKDINSKAKEAKIGICILYSEDKEKVLLVDYSKKHKVLERFNYEIIDIECFFMYKKEKGLI